MKISILTTILKSYWLISGRYENMTLEEVIEYATSHAFAEEKVWNTAPFIRPIYGQNSTGNEQKRGNTRKNEGDSVAVIGINGPMVRSGVSVEGTDEIAGELKKAFQDNTISAIVMPLNSPGGTYASLIPLKQAFQKKNKPVVAWVDDQATSAAYYIAAFADEIYSSDQFNDVGSIGVMATFIDDQEKKKKDGLKVHSVYPPESPEKNSTLKKMKKGDFSELRETLSQIARHFQDHVTKQRPGVKEDVLKGKTYNSIDGPLKGLTDGIKNFEEVIQRAYALSIIKEIQPK